MDRIELERIELLRHRANSLPEIRFQTNSVPGGRGHVKNVSPTGLFVLTDDVPIPDESVHLSFQKDELEWIELLGMVRWTSPRENDPGKRGFGLEIYVTEDYKAYVGRLAASAEES